MKDMLKFMKEYYKDRDDLVGIEIGVLHGSNAIFMLENLPIKKLYLIDPYLRYSKSVHYTQERLDKAYRYMKEHVVDKYNDRVVFIKKKSEDATGGIEDKVDFIYIDGNHIKEYVDMDINNYYELLKDGGVFGGHDYNLVSRSVNEFIEENNYQLFIGDGKGKGSHKPSEDWWVIK